MFYCTSRWPISLCESYRIQMIYCFGWNIYPPDIYLTSLFTIFSMEKIKALNTSTTHTQFVIKCFLLFHFTHSWFVKWGHLSHQPHTQNDSIALDSWSFALDFHLNYCNWSVLSLHLFFAVYLSSLYLLSHYCISSWPT